jgi:hypothetical protein
VVWGSHIFRAKRASFARRVIEYDHGVFVFVPLGARTIARISFCIYAPIAVRSGNLNQDVKERAKWWFARTMLAIVYKCTRPHFWPAANGVSVIRSWLGPLTKGHGNGGEYDAEQNEASDGGCHAVDEVGSCRGRGLSCKLVFGCRRLRLDRSFERTLAKPWHRALRSAQLRLIFTPEEAPAQPVVRRELVTNYSDQAS